MSENQDKMLVQTASRSVCACMSCYDARMNFLSSTSSLCCQALEERGWWLWGHGPGWLLSLAAQTHIAQSQAEPECCKWHFFLRCLLQKEIHHFSFLLWGWKHWWSSHFSFSFIFHEAKEVMEEMGNWEDIAGTMRNLGLQSAVA